MQRLSRIKSARRSTIPDQRLAHTSALTSTVGSVESISMRNPNHASVRVQIVKQLLRRERRNDRMMRIMFFIFVGIFLSQFCLVSRNTWLRLSVPSLRK